MSRPPCTARPPQKRPLPAPHSPETMMRQGRETWSDLPAGREDDMAHDGTAPRGPRCIALVGPFQSGKTTLLEAILARSGTIPRQGSVDTGTSIGDASKEARHHKMSVEATFATVNFMGDSYTFV